MRVSLVALQVVILVAVLISVEGGGESVLKQYKNELPVVGEFTLCDVSPLTCEDQSKVAVVGIERALVIAAHPDDIESVAGGTVAALVAKGVEVRYILVTNGDRGTQNRTMTPEKLAVIRQIEQLRAAAVLGVRSVDFLNVEDGAVVNSPELQMNLTRLIRKYKPNAIFTWDPALSGREDLYLKGFQHSDHRTTGLATLDVVYPKIRDFLYWPQLIEEGYEPWHVSQVFLFAFHIPRDAPDSIFFVDITSFMPLKIKALLQHYSQISDPQSQIDFLNSIGKSLASHTFPPISGTSSPLAEWFRRVLFLP